MCCKMGSLVSGDGVKQRLAAGLEMIARLKLTHARPDFDINSVRVGNREVPVSVETALDLPFGQAFALRQG